MSYNLVEIIQAVIYGLLSGILTGIMPGINILLGFMLFLPFVPLDPLCIVLYGIISRIGSQFFGSMAVLYLKIPGESSSYPVLLELKNLKNKDIFKAVMLTNIGSLAATVLSSIILFLILFYNFSKNIYFPILLKASIFWLLVMVCIFANKKIFTNIFILLAATIINFYAEIAAIIRTHEQSIPIYYFNTQLILIIIFISQLLWQQVPTTLKQSMSKNKTKLEIKKYIGKISLHSLFGCLLGLLPQLGATISSYVSYTFEKFRKNKALDKITASETANNGAAITGWLPLLLFGIPLSASEIVLLQYFQKFNLNFEFLQGHGVSTVIIFCLLVSGLIYFLIATLLNQKYYLLFGKLISQKWFSYFLFFLSLSCFYFTNAYELKYLIIHLIIFLPIGYLLYFTKTDLLAVVIGLLLTGEIYYTTYRVIQIYF
jgi:putative tricarboxylic transport membrane protein